MGGCEFLEIRLVPHSIIFPIIADLPIKNPRANVLATTLVMLGCIYIFESLIFSRT